MEASIIETTSNFIKRGEYKPTELDNYKASVDFLITSCSGKSWEVVFNHDVTIKTSRSIKACPGNSRAFFVTDKGLEQLKSHFTHACDF